MLTGVFFVFFFFLEINYILILWYIQHNETIEIIYVAIYKTIYLSIEYRVLYNFI